MEPQHHHATTLSPSNSMLVPYATRHLAVAPPPIARLSIPAGWGVEQVPRPDGSRSDMYYFEPGTGKRFRSTREIQRYLNEKQGYPIPCRRSTRISTSNHLRVNDEVRPCELAIVPSGKSAPAAPFVLPDGWIVEEVPRRGYHGWSDKYYYEPGTGRKFRSLAAVERHVSPPTPTEPFVLPDDWIVEEVPRKGHHSWTDKYYYEPGTGRRFRSLVAVERHLAELEENAPLSKALEEIKDNKPLSKVFKLENLTKKSKKKTSQENRQASSFMGPPMKVKWVLASPQGDTWNPFIAEALVSDAVKQQWANRFMVLMKDGHQ